MRGLSVLGNFGPSLLVATNSSRAHQLGAVQATGYTHGCLLSTAHAAWLSMSAVCSPTDATRCSYAELGEPPQPATKLVRSLLPSLVPLHLPSNTVPNDTVS